ncbi:hypothetical protein [Niveibacterium umoris]|nr:hypothetical protein [Niveibacterium umoris]
MRNELQSGINAECIAGIPPTRFDFRARLPGYGNAFHIFLIKQQGDKHFVASGISVMAVNQVPMGI